MLVHIPAGSVFPPPGIHRQHHTLAAEPGRCLGDQLRPVDGGGIDGNFVRSLTQHLAEILHCADAAAHGKGDGQLPGHPRGQINHSSPSLMRSGDIQKHHLVGSGFRVSGRHLHRVARVPQIDKIHPFDHPAIPNIQTGYNTFGVHQRPSSPASAAKLRSICSPTRPDFSGWYCMPITLSRCTAA